MSLPTNDTAALYTPGTPPSNPNDPVYLQNELKKIRTAFSKLEERGPKAATQAPTKPQPGWIRFAEAPWNPLGTGSNVMVYYSGTAWTAL
jgi:hypothetical protein